MLAILKEDIETVFAKDLTTGQELCLSLIHI